jgi:hypothetical protein
MKCRLHQAPKREEIIAFQHSNNNIPEGALYVGKFSGKGGDEVVGGATSKAPNYNIKKAELLGHNNENDTRQMASHLDWTITRGPLELSESCAKAKARQKNVPKISTGEKGTVINGQWFQDSSTLKVHKDEKGSSKIWDLTVDELTGSPFTGIYNKKNEFVKNMCQHIQADSQRLPCHDYETGQCWGKQEIGEEIPKCRLKTASENGVHSCKYPTAECSGGSQIHLPSSKGQGSHACC